MNFKLATHAGSFHADDVFACMVIRYLFPCDIYRVNQANPIDAEYNFYVDIGHLNDGNWFFDHHQKERGGCRENGNPYAAFGLVWKAFGMIFCEKILGGGFDFAHIADRVDSAFVQALDLRDDTGARPEGPVTWTDVSTLIAQMNPISLDDIEPTPEQYDECFNLAMIMAEGILRRFVFYTADSVLADLEAEKAERLDNGAIVVLKRYREVHHWLSENDPAAMIFIHKGLRGGWCARTVPTASPTVPRKPYPASWRGLQPSQLAEVTGVKDAQFCAPQGFLAGATSYEGALALARLSLAQ